MNYKPSCEHYNQTSCKYEVLYNYCNYTIITATFSEILAPLKAMAKYPFKFKVPGFYPQTIIGLLLSYTDITKDKQVQKLRDPRGKSGKVE